MICLQSLWLKSNKHFVCRIKDILAATVFGVDSVTKKLVFVQVLKYGVVQQFSAATWRTII